jgi:hypothetical protein
MAPIEGAAAAQAQQCPPGGVSWLTRQDTAAATEWIRKAALQSSQTNATAEKCAHQSIGTDDSSSTAVTPLPLTRVVAQLEQIIQMHELEVEAKHKIEVLIKYARKESKVLSKWAEKLGEQAKVSIICEANRTDLKSICESITMQIEGLQESSNEMQMKIGKTIKAVEETKDIAKELASKVNKVTEATDKIASKTESYRDVLLASPAQGNKVKANPRVLGDIERKAKQILVEIFNIEGNNTMAKSLTELVSKAKEAIDSLEDVDKPKDIKVITAHKARREVVLLTLNSKEAVQWIK